MSINSGLMFLVAIVFLLSCKSNDARISSDELRQPGVEFRPCLVDHFDPNLPKTNQYLKNLMMFLMQNNEQIFQGPYDPANFCIGASKEESSNAFAHTIRRQVAIGPLILKYAEVDSQIAGTIAHELGHIVMNHGYGGSKNMQDREAYREKILFITDMTEQLSPRKEALEREKAELDDAYQKAFTQTIAKKPELYQNFQKLSQLSKQFLDGKQEQQNGELLPLLPDTKSERRFTTITDAYAIVQRIKASNTPPTSAEKTLMDTYDLLMRDAYTTNPKLSNFKSKLDANRQARLAFDKEWSKLIAIQAQADAIETHGMNPDQAANWAEEEADNVGYKLYNQANLQDLEYVFLLTNKNLYSGDETSSATEHEDFSIARNCKDPNKIERGLYSHPEKCWRILNIVLKQRNILLRERRYHSHQHPRNFVISASPSLQEVQQEIALSRKR